MQRYARQTLLSITLFLAGACLAQRAPAGETAVTPASLAADSVDVQHVMDAYHEAVVHHDGARLASLFLPQASIWLNVLADDTYALARAKSPDATKVRVGSHADFARLVSSAKGDFNPTQSHLQMNSDGTIASVYFDFAFLIDGKEQNRGSEAWQLVRSSEGWRIAAIIYSSHPKLN
jgi:hypothetical protein